MFDQQKHPGGDHENLFLTFRDLFKCVFCDQDPPFDTMRCHERAQALQVRLSDMLLELDLDGEKRFCVKHHIYLVLPPVPPEILPGKHGLVIPADFDWRNAKSPGLRLVISLVEQLRGMIELYRTGGTAFIIVVKEKE